MGARTMENIKYIKDVSTLALNVDKCIACGMCQVVCPHRVFCVCDKKAQIVDKNACMECGACAKNCPVTAIDLKPGVGCASYIIQTWIKKDKASCGCGSSECC